MTTFITFLFSQSILLPFIIGLVRIRKIQNSYYPFLVLIILGTINEFVSYGLIRMRVGNAVSTNIYSLLECLLILYQFYRWRFNAKPRAWYWAVPAFCVLIWITEMSIIGINRFAVIFPITYAFLIVVLSINEINYLITHENRQLFKNARFVICMGFIIFFLYAILLNWALYMTDIDKNDQISDEVISLAAYINATVNVIYAVAMLLIPAKILDFDGTMENFRKQYHSR